jgi:hypothetical protein
MGLALAGIYRSRKRAMTGAMAAKAGAKRLTIKSGAAAPAGDPIAGPSAPRVTVVATIGLPAVIGLTGRRIWGVI